MSDTEQKRKMMSLLIAFTFIIKTSGNNRDHCEIKKSIYLFILVLKSTTTTQKKGLVFKT